MTDPKTPAAKKESKPFQLIWAVVVFAFKILLVLGLYFLHRNYTLWKLSEYVHIRFAEALLFYLISNIVIGFVKLLVISFYLRRTRQEFNRDNFVLGVEQIADLASVISIIISVSLIFDVNLISFLTSLSVVAAALAIIFKDYISNMINGMILMFSDQISVNDQVKIGKHKGRIVDINLMNIHLLCEEDESELVYIPNNTVFSNEVVNYTKRVARRLSFDFEMDYKYLKNLNELEVYLRESLKDYQSYVDKKGFLLRVVELRKDAASLRLQYDLLKRERKTEQSIRKKIARTIINYIHHRIETETTS